MKISFFEEFATKKNLAKLKLVKWPTKLYMAASSLKEFEKIKKETSNKNITQFVYWPTLSKKEGYWISPYSKRSALKRLTSELIGQKISVMLDLELPTTQNIWLYATQALNFFRNKRLIRKFIADYKGEVYTAEYFPLSRRMKWLGLHFDNPKIKVIKMLYHSTHHFKEDFLLDYMKKGKQRWGENFIVGFGTIAKGIHNNDPILDQKVLARDLALAKQVGVKEVIIFRLGGLDDGYLRVFQKFT